MAEGLDKILECILFVEGEPLSLRRLARIAAHREPEVRAALETLLARLREGSGLRLIENDGAYQLVTAPEHAPLVEKLFRAHTREELSRAALEVLSIIAYRGPISRAELEMIRGVNSTFIVRSLLMRGLIARVEKKGVGEFELSMETLRKFGLERKEELPRWHELREEITKAESALSNIPHDTPDA